MTASIFCRHLSLKLTKKNRNGKCVQFIKGKRAGRFTHTLLPIPHQIGPIYSHTTAQTVPILSTGHKIETTLKQRVVHYEDEANVVNKRENTIIPRPSTSKIYFMYIIP